MTAIALLGAALLLAAATNGDGLAYAYEPWGSCTHGSRSAACADPTPVRVEDQLGTLARAEQWNADALAAALRQHRDCQEAKRPGVVPSSFLVRTADARMRPTILRASFDRVMGGKAGWVVAQCYGGQA
jgi:hypothetical protein